MKKIALEFHNIIFILSSFWVVGYFFFPTGKLHNQAFVALIVLPAIWIMFKLKIAFKPFLESKLFALVVIFCAYYAISTVWGSYESIGSQINLVKRVLYLYAFWLTIFVAFKLNNTKLIVLTKCIVCFALINLIFNAIVFYGIDHNTIYDRFNGFGRMKNQLWVGAIYGAVAIMMLIITLKPQNNQRLFHSLIFLVFFVANLLTHSRGPIFSMLAVCMLTFFLSPLSLKTKFKISTIFLIVSSIFALALYKYYLADISRGQSYRLDLWLGFLQFTKNHLFLGHGAGVSVVIDAPGQVVDQWSHYHNIYLGSLIELGLTGLFLHLLIVIYTIYVGWQNKNYIEVNIALMIFIFTCLVGFTFGQGIITGTNAQWIIFWLPLAFIIMRDLEQKKLQSANNLLRLK